MRALHTRIRMCSDVFTGNFQQKNSNKRGYKPVNGIFGFKNALKNYNLLNASITETKPDLIALKTNKTVGITKKNAIIAADKPSAE